jgi:alpha-glucosidase
MAVAETWYPTNRRTYLYGRPSELGQVFDFSLLKAEWGRDSFLQVIHRSLGEHRAAGSGLTWVLSSHDVPRHPSRYALPPGVDPDDWLLSNGTRPVTDPQKAHRRGRAATLMMLALPGSAYLYQGEELGLLEVAELREEQLRDPVWERSGHQLKGRDGCRVPLPWTRSGSSFGFGDNGAWLPQPAWFTDYAVDGQMDAPGSSLTLYRQALALRRRLHLGDSSVAWLDAEDDEVIHFARAGGWQCLVNFSAHPRPVPPGEVLLSSSPIHDGMLPGEATVWLKGPPRVAGS